MATATKDKLTPAEQAAAVQACKTLLAVLGSISTLGERIASNAEAVAAGKPESTGSYRLNRSGDDDAEITAADIRLAAETAASATATLEDCRKALTPLAALPLDGRVVGGENAPLYVFPDGKGGTVTISNAQIRAAKKLLR